MKTLTGAAAHINHMTLTNLIPGAPIIFGDMDGTIFNWNDGLVPELLRRDPAYPVVRSGEQRDYNHLSGPGGDPKILAAAMNAPGLYRNLKPLPGAVDAVLAMEEAGLNFFFLSTPYVTHRTCASEKLESIEEHFGLRWVNRVILAHDKTLSSGDVLIDDKPEITGARTPDWTRVVFDQSYNRAGLENEPRITDWADWESVLYPVLAKRGHRVPLLASA